MKLKEYFKPNKRKIGISFLLIFLYIVMFFILKEVHSIFLFVFFVPLHLSYSIIMFPSHELGRLPLVISTLLCPLTFITYSSACYITINKKIIKGIIIYFTSIATIPLVLIFLILCYNNIFGYYCNGDSDCHFKSDVAGDFAVNDKYIPLLDDSYGSEVPICVNNRCTTIESAISAESCERINRELLARTEWLKSKCYHHVAINQNNKTLCEYVEDRNYYKRCIEHFKES